MKVLFCAYDRPGHLATGPNAWLQRLVPDLVQTYGLEVQTLFIISGDKNRCPTLSYFKEQGLPVNLINREEVTYIADQIKALLKVVKQEAIQVVVANLVIPALYATPYLKQANIPVVGVLHSNDLFYKSVIAKFIQGQTDHQLTAAVPVSHYISNLIELSTTSTQLKVIPCGTPMPDVKSNWTDNKTLKVMYAGRIVIEQKQVLKLTTAFLKAAKQESRLSFSIYGDGSHVEEVKALLHKHNQNQVHYKGAVSPSEIIACFQNHHIFTIMSDYEGMPVALMEAMACGLVPVCLEEASGVNEIIEHGVNGFIVKDRDADYQKHLQLLLDDPDLWQKLSINAVKTIEERYSSATTHQLWYELLQSFSDQHIKPIKIPRHIKLKGEVLYYGDNRKPTFFQKLQKSIKQNWMQLRLMIRPRARLKTLFNK